MGAGAFSRCSFLLFAFRNVLVETRTLNGAAINWNYGSYPATWLICLNPFGNISILLKSGRCRPLTLSAATEEALIFSWKSLPDMQIRGSQLNYLRRSWNLFCCQFNNHCFAVISCRERHRLLQMKQLNEYVVCNTPSMFWNSRRKPRN